VKAPPPWRAEVAAGKRAPPVGQPARGAKPLGVRSDAEQQAPPTRASARVGPDLGHPARRGRRGRRLGTLARLLGLHAVAVSVVLAVAVVAVVRDFTSHYQRATTRDLVEEVLEYSHEASARPANENLAAFTRRYLATRPPATGHVILIALHGQPILGTTGAATLAGSPTVRRWLSAPTGTRRTAYVTVDSIHYLILVSPIKKAGQVSGAFVAGADLTNLQGEHNRILLLAGIEAALALLVALVSTFLLLRHLLRTVSTITDTAEEISCGDLDRRINYAGSEDEVGRLALTFDHMIVRIADTLGAQRQLLSDVSHQLRTPLTVARGHLEVLERSGSEDRSEAADTVSLVIDELHHAGILVDRLLLLGRALEPDFIELRPLDLRAFMAELFDAAQVLADRRWSLGALPDVVIHADEPKLRGALLNLLENAVNATHSEDAIHLAANWEGEIVLSVADTGCGIPVEQQEAVFERFHRAQPADGRGSGLGLAIVKAVAEAHGGAVRLTSTPGQGTTISIVLPPSSVEQRTEQP
jgi:signal transduction histidine kinase